MQVGGLFSGPFLCASWQTVGGTSNNVCRCSCGPNFFKTSIDREEKSVLGDEQCRPTLNFFPFLPVTPILAPEASNFGIRVILD